MGDPNLEFMLEPDLWPRWPYLLLKKRNPTGGFPFVGTLAQMSEGKFGFAESFSSQAIRQGGLELIHELFDDGWVVD